MEVEASPFQPSPFLDVEHKRSHKTKKRKHDADSEPRASSKKRKHPDANFDLVPDTPTRISKPKKKSQPRKDAVEPPLPLCSPSSPSPPAPAPATVADSDDDISIPDAPSPTHRSPTTSPGPSTPSPFYSTTLSLYLLLPAIALSPITALPSLLTTALTPLLLSYYPPLRGIILAISNPVLSSKKPESDNPPSPLPPPPPPKATTDPNSSTPSPPPLTILAHCADTDGLSYIWLTATFLTFRPQINDELEGWVNVCSEGFVGLVCYNYFQVAVARSRIPAGWTWRAPGGEVTTGKGKEVRRRKRKGKRTEDKEEDDDDDDDDDGGVGGGKGATSSETLVSSDRAGDDGMGGADEGQEKNGDDEGAGAERESGGYFQREDGTKVLGPISFRVVDCEIVPGHDRESWSLQIEGTLLSPEDEEKVLEEERQKDLRRRRRQGKAVVRGGGGVGSGSRNAPSWIES